MHRGNPALAQNGGRELTKRFKVLEFLGKGSYGSVYRVQRRENGNVYAVKEMDVKSMGHAEKQDILNEVRLLASVRHPNVVSYHEAFVDGSRLCIVMEYAAGGDLATTIKKHRVSRKPINEDLLWKYFIQIVRGLEALHSLKIIHRDIKPGNILVTNTGHVKIADLGIAKLARNNMAKTQIGTPVYMAPEVWCKKPYSFSSDTWSLGCVLYEMATYNIPFDGRSLTELKQKILRGMYSPVPSYHSKDVADMVKRCLSLRPDARPSISRILGAEAVKKRAKLAPSGNETPAARVIDTIKLPRHKQIGEVRLPPAMYSMEIDEKDCPKDDAKYYRPPSKGSSRAPSRNGQPRHEKQQALPPLLRRPSEFNRAQVPRAGNPGVNRAPSRARVKLPQIPGSANAVPRPYPPRSRVPSAQPHRVGKYSHIPSQARHSPAQGRRPAWNYGGSTRKQGNIPGKSPSPHHYPQNAYGQQRGIGCGRYY